MVQTELPFDPTLLYWGSKWEPKVVLMLKPQKTKIFKVA